MLEVKNNTRDGKVKFNFQHAQGQKPAVRKKNMLEIKSVR